MPGIKPIHWKRFEKFLVFYGCYFQREKGDHRIYWKSGLARPIVIPRSPNLPVFVIRNNLRILDVSIQDYLKIMERI